MKLQCYKCGHTWNYKGERKYLTCPNCLYKIRQDKAIVGNLPNQNKEKIPTIPTIKKASFTLKENSHGDKLMEFDDGLKVLIPRAEILLPMLENWSKRNV